MTAMLRRPTLRISFGVILAALSLFYLVGAALNRTALTAVVVQLRPGVEEPGDHHLLGVGAKDKLPDYELSFRTRQDGWQTLGEHRNTSAKDGLEFRLSEPYPLRKVEELRLVEDDHLENDVLEQLAVTGNNLVGKAFDLKIQTTESWAAGAQWFWDSPIGKAILAGISIAVVILILAQVGV
jgi:hypothetical protein